jgi:hypothetical protein
MLHYLDKDIEVYRKYLNKTTQIRFLLDQIMDLSVAGLKNKALITYLWHKQREYPNILATFKADGIIVCLSSTRGLITDNQPEQTTKRNYKKNLKDHASKIDINVLKKPVKVMRKQAK